MLLDYDSWWHNYRGALLYRDWIQIVLRLLLLIVEVVSIGKMQKESEGIRGLEQNWVAQHLWCLFLKKRGLPEISFQGNSIDESLLSRGIWTFEAGGMALGAYFSKLASLLSFRQGRI